MIDFQFYNLLPFSNFMSSHMNNVTLYNRLIPHHFRHLFIYTFIYFISPYFWSLYTYTQPLIANANAICFFLLIFFFHSDSSSLFIIFFFCSIIQLLLLMMFHRGNLVKQEEENSIHRYFCFIGKQRWNLPSSRKIKFAMQIHFFSSFISHSFIQFFFLSFSSWIKSCYGWCS